MAWHSGLSRLETDGTKMASHLGRDNLKLTTKVTKNTKGF